MKNMEDLSPYEKEKQNESICPLCNIEMDFIKGKPKADRWDKFHDYYVCPVCGFRHRRRTYNEILRDIGERE